MTITATSGSEIAASSAIWPAPRIACSSTSTSVPSGAARISSGTPISVLKFARLATTRLAGASSETRMSLVVVLPVEPVTAITCAPSSRRHAVASRCSAASGLSAASTVACEASSRWRVLGRREHTPRPVGERLRGELAAIDVLASETDEQRAWAGLAGVDHDPLRARRRRRRRRDQPRARRARDALGRPALHERTGTPRNTSRATSRSSNGTL